jgi:hypothetical protein
VQAPDYVEPIVGWRLWRIAESRHQSRLTSLFLNDVWPWLEPLEARCAMQRVRWSRVRPPHAAPREDCQCGIYATVWSEIAPHLRNARWHRRPKFVVGEVALWGTVVVGELGWRSTYAYPQRMFALIPGKTSELEVARVLSSLGQYGVSVEPIDISRAAATIESRNTSVP